MKALKIIIPERILGNRIDAVISDMLPDYSRSKITAWIKSGDALINEKKNFRNKINPLLLSELVWQILLVRIAFFLININKKKNEKKFDTVFL